VLNKAAQIQLEEAGFEYQFNQVKDLIFSLNIWLAG